MTDLQLYLLVAPVVLLVVCGVGAYVGVRIIERQNPHPH
jgi:uncharacterized protein YneF (UPF0154 family)